MQLIYGGKTNQSLPRLKFPESFSLSVNPKHYSNTLESIKIIDEIIIPYANAQHEILSNTNEAALLIFDMFRGQITDEVTLHLLQNNIYFVTVPNNMTHLFQPLDLTINGHCKKVTKKEFAKWYMQQVDNALQVGTKLEDINTEFRLSVIKPLHTKWLVEYYNHISSETGTEVNGFKLAGIYDVIRSGKSSLQSIDPFNFVQLSDDLRRGYVNELDENESEEDEDTELDLEDDFNRNPFVDFIIHDE